MTAPAPIADIDAGPCPLPWHPRAYTGEVPAIGWSAWKARTIAVFMGMTKASIERRRLTAPVLDYFDRVVIEPDDSRAWCDYVHVPRAARPPDFWRLWMLAEGWAGFAPIPQFPVRGSVGKNGLWDPQGSAIEDLIALPVFEAEHDGAWSCIDVIAWRRDKPDTVFERFGLVTVLDDAMLAGSVDTPRLHRSPESWAAAGECRGAWVHPTELASRLAYQQQILCDDEDHAAYVHARLRAARPRLPDLLFESA